MITCGNCHGKHETANEVRDCYAGVKVRYNADGQTEESVGGIPAFATQPATERQVEFINTLVDERNTNALGDEESEVMLHVGEGKAISKSEASRLITALQKMPRQKHDPCPSVPDGKYAIEERGEAGRLTFWEVDKPTEGQWAGNVYINLIVGAPGDWRRVKVSKHRTVTATAQISEDPRAAAKLFGYKTQSCGRCGSPLSQPQSRAAGMGETCAHKAGWPYPSMEEALRILRELGEDVDVQEQLIDRHDHANNN